MGYSMENDEISGARQKHLKAIGQRKFHIDWIDIVLEAREDKSQVFDLSNWTGKT